VDGPARNNLDEFTLARETRSKVASARVSRAMLESFLSGNADLDV
jgi:hypothetical protein